MKDLLWRTWWHWLRWPVPLWRIRRRATVEVGGHRIAFVGVSSSPYVSWLQGLRLGLDEPLTAACLVRTLRPGDAFVDVGGYVGGYALLASRLVGPDGSVVVFEPDPVTRARLERNVAHDGARNVTVVGAAITGHTGRATIDAHGTSTSAVSAGAATSVPAWTLDDVFRDRGGWPDVVKIDIEGGEAAALTTTAAGETVARARAVVVEVHAFAGVDPDGIEAFFAGHGMHGTRLDARDADNFNVVFA